MKKNNLKKVFLLLVFLLGFSLIFWDFKSSLNFIPGEQLGYSQEYNRWSILIKKIGPQNTYSQFLDETNNLSFGLQHSQAHIIGAVFYDNLGIGGVSHCDNSFAFGCYHSFFSKALLKEGLKITKQLDQECLSKYGNHLPCQHGIGHGLLYYLGESKLNGALDECAKITWQEMGGCSSGVFMEYNFRTMADPTGRQVRRLADDDPFSPCTIVEEKFIPGCYFEQPQWWQGVFNNDFVHMGSLCNQLENEKGKQGCFQGIGNYSATSFLYDEVKTAENCAQMPSFGQADCVKGASWILLDQANGKEKALKICSSIKDALEAESCVKQLKTNPLFNES